MEHHEKKVLLIEDDAAMRTALRDALVAPGMSVLEGTDGDTGLMIALKEHPDLVLLDLLMPNMDGITFLKKLRGDSWGREVPVVVLTNLNSTQSVAEVLEHGSYDYLVKANVTLAEVAAKIQDRLKMAEKETGTG